VTLETKERLLAYMLTVKASQIWWKKSRRKRLILKS